jgi:hypothetical protein
MRNFTMMISYSKISLFILSTGILFSACLKPDTYSEIPEISVKTFEAFGDTAHLYINFTDGDGDVGLDQDEINPPYDTSSQFYYNLFIGYYEKVNGVFVRGKDANNEDIMFNYRVPVLTPKGQNKALKGVIRISILPVYYDPTSPDSDTIQYEIQLADRALHLSNVVRTDEIRR